MVFHFFGLLRARFRYKLGSDLDYLMSNINLQLMAKNEKRLRNAFNDGDSTIPFPILALSISNLYSGLIMSWFHTHLCKDQKDRQVYSQAKDNRQASKGKGKRGEERDHATKACASPRPREMATLCAERTPQLLRRAWQQKVH